jgi:hypothetical protein
MKIMNILEIICLIAVIVVLLIFIVKVKSDGAKCIANPLKYSIEAMSERNSANLSCSCKWDNIKIAPIVANSSGIYSITQEFISSANIKI